MIEKLKKDQEYSLSAAVPGISNIMVGAGWDVNQFEGKDPLDLDLSCFLLNHAGQTREDSDFVFYNNLEAEDGAVSHKGDNRTGAGEGDDEIIFLDLSRIDYEVSSIQFVVSIYEGVEKGHDFSGVENAFIRIVNEDSRDELVRFDLTEDFAGEQAILFGSLERMGNDWTFKASGEPVEGGLSKIAQKYGLLISGV